MPDLSKIPLDAVGLRLCKIVNGSLIMCESVTFRDGRSAVNTILRRAAMSGIVGEIGKTGKFWADFIDENDNWMQTISLDRAAWNSLKNHWMRCKIWDGGKNGRGGSDA